MKELEQEIAQIAFAKMWVYFVFDAIFKLFIPHSIITISTTVPTKNATEGSPSMMILTIRPNAKPPIKITLLKVAFRQCSNLKMPMIQYVAKPTYRPIVALKT
jgi:hypothetical protein